MIKIKPFIFTIFLTLFPFNLYGEIEDGIKLRLDEQLKINGERYGVVGQSVIILKNDKPYYDGREGFSNIEFEIPVENGNLFPSYSVTKLFTSTLIMQLVDQEQLDVKQSIKFYLPYLPDNWKSITIEHVLNHTSGIPRYFDIAMRKNSFLNTKKDVFLSLIDEPEHFKIGTTNRYNNTNYLILSEILETVTGKTYQQLIKEKIIDQLELKNTGHASAKTVIDKMVTSYQGRDGEVRRNIDIDWPIYTFSHSALYSTPLDLTTFMTALANGDLVSDVFKYWQPMNLVNGRSGSYAFGFEYAEEDGYIRVGHDGGNRVKLRHYFSKNSGKDTYTIAYLTNGNSYNVWTDVLTDSLMSIVSPDQFKKAVLNEKFMEQVLLGDKGNLEIVYEKAFNYFNHNHCDTERFLNNYSYAIRFGAGNQPALEAFSFVTMKYPRSANAWDNLGGAWLLQNDKEMAIKFYRKALEVDPKWVNATIQIRKLVNPE